MKVSVLKKLFVIAALIVSTHSAQAQFNYQFSDASVPVTGITYGVVGGGHTALLYNRDDFDTIGTNQSTSNFTYFAGVERIRWYTPHIGIGQQGLFWNAGAKYTVNFGDDENAPRIDGTTTLSYIKIPVLFYYKSYSRWKPDRRLRVNTFFGPYIAMLQDAKEEWTVSVPAQEIKNSYTLSRGSYIGKNKDNEQFFDGKADDALPFKMFDYGFTMGAGIEMRLWTKTVVALTIRTDLGLAEVENKNFEVDYYDPGNIIPQEQKRYRFYKDVVGKYNPYPFSQDEEIDFNRPETRNMSFGAQLSIRKYFGAK